MHHNLHLFHLSRSIFSSQLTTNETPPTDFHSRQLRSRRYSCQNPVALPRHWPRFLVEEGVSPTNCFTMLRRRIFPGKETAVWVRCLSSLQRRTPKAGLVKSPVGYEHFTKFDAARAFRRQHQLATMDDQQLRETRRLLVLSLQEIVFTFPKYAACVGSQKLTNSLPLESTSATDSVQPPQDYFQCTHPVEFEHPTPTIDKPPKATQDNVSKVDERPTPEALLWNAIRCHDVNLTIRLFKEALECDQKLSGRVLVRIFYLVVPTDTILAYSVLRKYRREDEKLTDPEMKMYFKLCSSVGSLDPGEHNNRWYLHKFVRDLVQDLKRMERDANQELLPKTITALATQRNVRIGTYANELYQYMVENEYKMKTGWLRQLLSLSKYNRQDDLPFHDIMERLATQNGRPHPLSVIQAIHNMFPFADPEKTCVALKAFLDFQKGIVLDDFPQPTTFDELQIDLDCLESISAGAAHSGSPELVSLVWEVLEKCEHRPTEAIYENTVIAFAYGGKYLETAFGVINSMKEDGFEVSRSLLRSFSLALR